MLLSTSHTTSQNITDSAPGELRDQPISLNNEQGMPNNSVMPSKVIIQHSIF